MKRRTAPETSRPGWTPGPPRPELAPGFWKPRTARAMNQVLGRMANPSLRDSLFFSLVDRIWPEVVGEEIAALGIPESMISGELRVRVAHPVWRTELGSLTEDIRLRLNAQLREEAPEACESPAPGTGDDGPIRRLRFV